MSTNLFIYLILLIGALIGTVGYGVLTLSRQLEAIYRELEKIESKIGTSTHI